MEVCVQFAMNGYFSGVVFCCEWKDSVLCCWF